jgi:hypothetical protein
VAGLFLLSCTVHLKELPLAVKEEDRRQQTVAVFRRLATPREVALGSTSLYYDLRASGHEVYWTYDRSLPPHPDIIRDVCWLVMAEIDQPILTGLLGGSWEQVYISDSASPRAAQGRYVILRRSSAAVR